MLHAAFLGIVAGAAWQSHDVLGVDRRSLLYTLISGEEVTEGTLHPSAYAQADGPGIGGARLAAMDVGSSLVTIEGQGGEIFEEEFQASQIMGGNAVLAIPDPDVTETKGEGHTSRRITTYTVQEGDTLDDIAKRHKITLNSVLWANNLRPSDTLTVGDVLTIPPMSGVIHKVKSGDTVERLADLYGVRGIEIAKYNGLEDSNELHVDQILFIPDGAKPAPASPRIVPRSQVAVTEPAPPGVGPGGAAWLWPTTTRHIAQGFRAYHTGVDLDNKYERAFATRAGKATFVGWLGGYGNLVILDHGDGFTTYYAHLSKFYVTKDQSVAKGDVVGQVGSTGRSSGPHLHFEIRKSGIPHNPLGYF